MSTAHESKSTGKGSKQTISTIFGDLELEISVRGYKSSEGGQVLAPPSERSDEGRSEGDTSPDLDAPQEEGEYS